jgi:hypothetical protein
MENESMPGVLRPSAGLGNTALAVDWNKLRYGAGVLCEFRPRPEYQGRAIRPGMAEKAGAQFVLRALWKMGADDPYPGEYALSTADSCGELTERLGIVWVASGDVVVLPNVKLNRT